MSIVKISKQREQEAIERLAADVRRRQTPNPIAELQAENERLRAALRAVEWVYNAYEDMMCPWCGAEQDYHDGHKPDCARQSALEPAPQGWEEVEW